MQYGFDTRMITRQGSQPLSIYMIGKILLLS